MIGKFVRYAPRNIHPIGMRMGCYNFMNIKNFSDDSHDDFKPKRKDVPSDGIVPLIFMNILMI